jgi:hypothetical protein
VIDLFLSFIWRSKLTYVFLTCRYCCLDIDTNTYTSSKNRFIFLPTISPLCYLILFFSRGFYDYCYCAVYSDWWWSNRNVYWKLCKYIHRFFLTDCALFFLRRCILNLRVIKKSIRLIYIVNNNRKYIISDYFIMNFIELNYL